ncbi:MAG TPA: hypothetical protein VF575_00745 [Candidatus Saccharimonadales bacterium]|jgi:hypothetical protein
MNHFRLLIVVLITLGTAVLGTIYMKSSQAATPFVSLEPETGEVAAPSTVVTDTTASTGKAIKFAATSTQPPATGTRTCPAYPAFPNDDCTGVPSDTSLTAIAGGLSTSANGQVIDGRLINGDLSVNHSNVTVKNTRIMGRISNRAPSNLIVMDSDIGPDSCPASSNFYNNFNGTNYTMLRSRVHSAPADLVGIGGTGTIVIRDSIINRACIYPGDHLDAIQWYAPGEVGNVTIDHSIVDTRPVNSPGSLGNAAIFWADRAGSGSRLTATNNWFAGGNYTVSLYDANAGSGVILDVRNNTFLKNSYTYGACASANSIPFNGSEGVRFTGNIYHDGSAFPSC